MKKIIIEEVFDYKRALGCDGNTFWEIALTIENETDSNCLSNLEITMGGRQNSDSSFTTKIIGIDSNQIQRLIDSLMKTKEYLYNREKKIEDINKKIKELSN